MNRLKILFVLLGMCLLYSCTSSPIPPIRIGQSQDAVLDYLSKNIVLHDEWDNLETEIKEARNGDLITLRNCECNGIVYHKIRVYFTTKVVRKIELEINKEYYKIINDAMIEKYGEPTIVKMLGYTSYQDFVLFSSENEECAVTETGENFEYIIAKDFDQYKQSK